MGTRYEPVPVCDADGRDAKAVRKFAWTEDGKDTFVIELGDDEEHECYRSVVAIMDTLRPHSKPLSAMVDVVAEVPRINVDNELEPPEHGEVPEPAAEQPGKISPERLAELQEPGRVTEPDAEPAEMKLDARYLTTEERKTIREWWGKNGKAVHAHGEPTTRGRLSQGLVDMYCEVMNRRMRRRENVEA